MRFSKLLLAFAAAGAIAAGAAAQEQAQEQVEKQKAAQEEQPAPAEPAPEPVPPQESRGLEELEGTVNALEEESPPQPPAEGPPPASPEAAAQPETPAAEPAPEPETQAPAATPSGPAAPLTRAEQAQLRRIVERGRLLAALARGGMIATQDMLSRVSDPEGAGITGWLGEPEGNGMAVTFYADSDSGPRVVYRASVLGGRVTSRDVHVLGDRPPLTAIQARMAAARAAAAAQDHRPCGGDQFNYLIVPPPSADVPVEVYQVTPALRRGRLPIGGHFRTTVSADGSIAETRGFTNACLDAEVPPVAAGQQPRPIGVTHLRDPMPAEIHVFAALLAGRPLLVATGDPERVWLVTGESIAEVRPRS